jgi:hypothetical protein
LDTRSQGRGRKFGATETPAKLGFTSLDKVTIYCYDIRVEAMKPNKKGKTMNDKIDPTLEVIRVCAA